MKTIFGIDCDGPDLVEADALEALAGFQRMSAHNQAVLAKAYQKLLGENWKMRDVEKYCCQWCGNSIPEMAFQDIVQMIRCFQEVLGAHAFQLIETNTGVSRLTVYNWVAPNTPNKKMKRSAAYDYVIKVAQFVREEIRKFSKEQKERYHQLYPKAS